MLRKAWIGLFALLAASVLAPGFATAAIAPWPKAEVEQAVIDAIPAWHGQKATVLKYLDLTRSFDTRSPWALVVAQDPQLRPLDPFGDTGQSIAVCLVKGVSPHCTEVQERPAVLFGEPAFYETWYAKSHAARMYTLRDARIVHAGQHTATPLVLLKTSPAPPPTGGVGVQTTLYRYDRKADRFHAVFINDGGGSNNQDAHFVESGPLQGDEIVDFSTGHAPYVYWIEAYAPHGDGPYRRILRYRSSTHYADGNPLPVADSEMPNILRRLGLWKPGDPLPVPQPLPANCGRLVLNGGEEWCRNLCTNYGGNHCSRFTKATRSAARGR